MWLLEASKSKSAAISAKQSLLRAVVAAGVSEKRVLFAPRADKNAHIRRHAAADLFLDTIVYGAHSTATDALRGVRPLLHCFFRSRIVLFRSTASVALLIFLFFTHHVVGTACTYAERRGLPQSRCSLIICIIAEHAQRVRLLCGSCIRCCTCVEQHFGGGLGQRLCRHSHTDGGVYERQYHHNYVRTRPASITYCH